jgi:hypothetical protein
MTAHAHDDRCTHPSQEVILHGVSESVRRYGWHCVGVFDDPGTGSPQFAYTIGLHKSWKHPELVIVGLPPEGGHHILSRAVEQISDYRRHYHDGERVAGLLPDSYEVLFQKVHLAYAAIPFGISDAWYEEPVPRLQVLWPDTENRLPHQLDCDQSVRAAQDIYA